MCELHWIKFFVTFPVKLNPQAWKLHVKSLHCRSPKNRFQVLGKELASRQGLRGLWVQKCYTFRSRKHRSQQLHPSGDEWTLSRAPRRLPDPAELLFLWAAEKLPQLDLKTKLAHQWVGVLRRPSEFQSPGIQASFLAGNLHNLHRSLCSGGSCTRFKLCYCMSKWLSISVCFLVCLSVCLCVLESPHFHHSPAIKDSKAGSFGESVAPRMLNRDIWM